IVRLTIWDNQAANFKELQGISNRKYQVLRNISLLHGNYHLPQHKERASTLITTLISYNASKRGIN
ncbi:unnamed protein product, partial [Brassica oleracea]